MVAPRYRNYRMLVQTTSVNVDCRKLEWRECFISCIIGCHTPARVVKEDEESRSEPHGTPKHNSELCSRIAHYSAARNRHFWRDTTDTRFGQQPHIAQGHTSCRNKENRNTKVHGDGGLGQVKPAREPVSSRPKPCTSLKKVPKILPVRLSLSAFVGSKQAVVRDRLFPQNPPGSRI